MEHVLPIIDAKDGRARPIAKQVDKQNCVSKYLNSGRNMEWKLGRTSQLDISKVSGCLQLHKLQNNCNDIPNFHFDKWSISEPGIVQLLVIKDVTKARYYNPYVRKEEITSPILPRMRLKVAQTTFNT